MCYFDILHRTITRFCFLTITLVSCVTFQASLSRAAESDSASLNAFITNHMKAHHIPGLAVSAVYSGEVVWTGTYGFGNIESQVPVEESTLFQIASVSKPITAIIFLSLYDLNSFELDDDINTHIPFGVRNPNHPDIPITIRQLLRHRSSIIDNLDYMRPFWQNADGDPTLALGDYLKDYLSIDGAHYSIQENFLYDAPGVSKAYCNTCYALIGYLAESISGEPFELLSKRILFDPLEMNDTAWFLKDLEGKNIAMPYHYDPADGYLPYGHNGYPDWPAGQLRTSIEDIATFLAAYSNNGINGNGRVIGEKVIEILSPENPELGFHAWEQRGFSNGQIVYQHGGGDIGVRTYMAFDRTESRGVVVLSNGEGPVAPIAERVFLAIDSLLEEI